MQNCFMNNTDLYYQFVLILAVHIDPFKSLHVHNSLDSFVSDHKFVSFFTIVTDKPELSQ